MVCVWVFVLIMVKDWVIWDEFFIVVLNFFVFFGVYFEMVLFCVYLFGLDFVY